MKFGGKDIVIGLLLVVLLVLVFMKIRRTSYADTTTSPSPVALPPAAQLPSGSILGKMTSEDCATKYGAGWSKFTDTLCKKS